MSWKSLKMFKDLKKVSNGKLSQHMRLVKQKLYYKTVIQYDSFTWYSIQFCEQKFEALRLVFRFWNFYLDILLETQFIITFQMLSKNSIPLPLGVVKSDTFKKNICIAFFNSTAFVSYLEITL